MSDSLLSLASDRIITPDGDTTRIICISNKDRLLAWIIPLAARWLLPTCDADAGFCRYPRPRLGKRSFAWKGERHSLQAMSRDLVNAGVTAWLATSATQPEAFLLESLTTASDWIAHAKAEDGAEAVGIHMEGPFINAKYSGMQRKESIQTPSIEGFERYQQAARGHIRLMTLAPELPGCAAAGPVICTRLASRYPQGIPMRRLTKPPGRLKQGYATLPTPSALCADYIIVSQALSAR